MKVAEKNIQNMVEIMEGIQFTRDPTKLIEMLVQTDYFYAPASTKFHDACQGGLYIHSKQMYESMLKLNELVDNKFTKQTLFYVSFFHDVCKVNLYIPKDIWYKELDQKLHKDVWKSKPGYGFDDKLPIGHGQKSIIMILPYIKLTDEQMMAIRWHMAAFEAGVSVGSWQKNSYYSAIEKTQLVSMAQSADIMSTAISAYKTKN